MTDEVITATQETTPGAAVIAPTPEVTAAPELQPKPEAKTFTQEEVNALVEKRLAREARKRERELEATVREMRAAQQPAPKTEAASDAPKREDFDDYEAYVEARARHVAREELKSEREEQAKAASEAKVKAEREESVKTFDERMRAAAAKYGDFEEVIEAAKSAHITDAMFDAMTATEEGADIAYHFGKHPEEAQRIAALSPKAQAVEIGKLAARIAAGASSDAPASTAAAPAPKPAPVSKAPEPIKPVGGSATVEKDPSQMTDKEFDAWLNKRMGRAR